MDREFPTIQIDNIQINSIKGYWDARTGYFVRFKILVDTGHGLFNLTGCTLEAKPGGLVAWRSPLGGTTRAIESDLRFYNTILEAFAAQSWFRLIGSSRLLPTALDLPANDPLQAALKAATEAL